jgi:hypothetical protein
VCFHNPRVILEIDSPEGNLALTRAILTTEEYNASSGGLIITAEDLIKPLTRISGGQVEVSRLQDLLTDVLVKATMTTSLVELAHASEERLCEHAGKVYKRRRLRTYEWVIVTDAQLLAHHGCLSFLDALVTGGLGLGRWTMIADANHDSTPVLREELHRYLKFSPYCVEANISESLAAAGAPASEAQSSESVRVNI